MTAKMTDCHMSSCMILAARCIEQLSNRIIPRYHILTGATQTLTREEKGESREKFNDFSFSLLKKSLEILRLHYETIDVNSTSNDAMGRTILHRLSEQNTPGAAGKRDFSPFTDKAMTLSIGFLCHLLEMSMTFLGDFSMIYLGFFLFFVRQRCLWRC